MAMRKSERLMNLLIMLLVARRHLDKDHIRGYLYADSTDDAFEKMFERDKDELRQLGIPIDMASQDVFFEDEQGYRIHRGAFELPDVALEADEAAVLGLAARVWQHAGLAGATSDAIVKLKAAGIEVDRSALDLVEPQLSAEEPSFDTFWAAAQRRVPVEFDYQRSGSAEVTTPSPPTVAGGLELGALVRPGSRHRSRRPPTVPALASPGCRHRSRRTRLLHPAGRRRLPRDDPSARAYSAGRTAGVRAGPQRRCQRVAQAGLSGRRGRRGPGRRPAAGTGSRSRARRCRRWPTRCSASGPTRTPRRRPS